MDTLEKAVQVLFKSLFDLDLDKIPESSVKTPDFICKNKTGPFFLCEIKSFQAGQTGPSFLNALDRKINEASRQFGDTPLPCVVVLCIPEGKDVPGIVENYLSGALDFFRSSASSMKGGAGKLISQMRASSVRSSIDLYVLTDSSGKNFLAFFPCSEEGGILAGNWFTKELP